jgi:hypothetical protein
MEKNMKEKVHDWWRTNSVGIFAATVNGRNEDEGTILTRLSELGSLLLEFLDGSLVNTSTLFVSGSTKYEGLDYTL